MDWKTLSLASVVILAGYALWFGLLGRRMTQAKQPARSARRGIRAAWLVTGLLACVAAWVVALSGPFGPGTVIALLALFGIALALWIIAPRFVTTKVVPLALVGAGIGTIIVADVSVISAPYWYGREPTVELVLGWALIAAGAWLTWRLAEPGSRLRGLFYEPASGGSRGSSSRASTAGLDRAPDERSPLGRPRWGLLLLVVTVLLLERLGSLNVPGPGDAEMHLAWVLVAEAILGAAAFVVFRFPAVAADLTIAGLVLFGLYGIAIALTWNWASQPVLYGLLTVGTQPVADLAAAQGLALVGAGIWLLPRALDDRTRSLFRPAADRELAGRVRRLAQTRADAVDSAAAELRRVERDLHDGAQARLIALGISLRAAERLIHASPDAAAALVAEARESSLTALGELRDLVRGIRPPVLADRGLADAVRALALDTPLRTDVDVDLPGRPDLAVESACYFAIAELLANAVKHSGARQAQVRICHDDRTLRITVTDDGAGGADPARGTGLSGLERRLATFDGVLAVSSPPGGPTIVAIEVPCALSSLKTSTC